MTDEKIGSANKGSSENVSDSELAQTERAFLRLTFWQTVLSVAGVVIAVIALYAALVESAAVRQQTAAAVWPYVQFSIEESDTVDAAEFTISFANTGVGPAKMRSLLLSIDGAPVTDWADAVTQVGGQVTDRVRRNFISNRVLSPGEKIDAFSTTDAELARLFIAKISDPSTYISFCYCSIFDECWTADSRSNIQDPQAVEECPALGEKAFRN